VSVHGIYIALEPSLDGKEPTAFKAVVLSSLDNGGASISLMHAWIGCSRAPALAPTDDDLVSARELESYFGCASITMSARAFGSSGSSLSPAGMPLTANMCAMESMHCWSVSVPGLSGGIFSRT
jgi:hypothetical protein